jgi:hypothetical protein
MKQNTRLLVSIILIIMVAGFVEFMAYVSSAYMIRYPVGFTPLNITESYEGYLKRYHEHPLLGWKSDVLDDDGNYIALLKSGPALSGHSQGQTPACVSLYGDSFTAGYGVKPQYAWSVLLSRLLHCRVANFGVSGFGTDQAYLKFISNHRDQAKVVILGFLTENLMRNVNQLRNLLSTSPTCILKPRFILNEHGELTLVPIPHLTKQEYDTLVAHPERILHHEFFLPGGPSGYHKMEFPYIWGFIKAFPLIFKNVVLHRGSYYDLYQPGNPSQAVKITLAIMEAFYREARQRGQQPVILIIPTHIDLAYYRRHRIWIYQPITDYLTKKGLDFIDAGPKFLHVLGESSVETLYSPKSMYHLSENGNAVLTKIVYDYLIQKHIKVGNMKETASQ